MLLNRESKKDEVLHQLYLEVNTGNFHRLNDEARSELIDTLKKQYPQYAGDIQQAYLNLLISLNPPLVNELRQGFSTKQFQIANDFERQQMLDRLMEIPAVSQGDFRLPREAVELIAKQETVDKPNSPFKVMQNVREVFQSRMFNNFSLADKRKYLELMLKQPSVIQAGITREDLQKAHYDIEVNTLAINSITADPLFLILSQLDPKSVLKACQITNRFQRLCRKPELFAALMRVHYPDSFETANPKEQYIAITNGLYTTYRMRRKENSNEANDEFVEPDWENFEDPVQYGKTQLLVKIPGFKLSHPSRENVQRLLSPGYIPQRLIPFTGYTENMLSNYLHSEIIPEIQRLSQEELVKLYEAGKLPDWLLKYSLPTDYYQDHDTEVVFSIKGYPIPHGTKAWLLILESHAAGIEDKVEVFKTKEALAKHFIEHDYPQLLSAIIDEFVNTLHEDTELMRRIDTEGTTVEKTNEIILASEEWKDEILQRELPYPFTAENVYKYLMENDHIQAYPDSERNSWLIRQVTF